MARLVLDTNLLVSAVLGEGHPRTLLRSCIDGAHKLLGSPATIGEFSEVLARPKFRMTGEEVARAVAVLVQTAELVETSSRLAVVTADPDDDRFLELAVDGKADLLVSGDRHVLDLQEFAGIPIVRAADAVKRLGLA